jgi:hypothetical protein
VALTGMAMLLSRIPHTSGTFCLADRHPGAADQKLADIRIATGSRHAGTSAPCLWHGMQMIDDQPPLPPQQGVEAQLRGVISLSGHGHAILDDSDVTDMAFVQSVKQLAISGLRIEGAFKVLNRDFVLSAGAGLTGQMPP